MTDGRNPHLGSTLDELLEEDGLLADARAVVAECVSGAGRQRDEPGLDISRSETALRHGTSRSASGHNRDSDSDG